MMRPPGNLSAALAILGLHLGFGTALASESTIEGRLTDARGAAVANATILVFPAQQGEQARLETDARGAFSAVLPAGRFVVAAMKPGFEIAMTQGYTGSRRVLRMRLQPSHPRALRADPQPAPWAQADWYLRRERADVLREEAASIPAVIAVTSTPADAGIPAAGENQQRALLGPIDGEFAHSFGAEDLLGLVDRESEGSRGGRTTALALRAPLSEALAWNLEGRSARSRMELPDGAGSLAGGSNQLAIGVDYVSDEGGARSGAIRAMFGEGQAGGSRISQRVVHGSGEMSLGGVRGRRLSVGVRAWDGLADLGDGSFLTLDQAVAPEASSAPTEGEGFSIYAGERLPIGPVTRLDYGLEYISDSLAGTARAVPRLGVSHTLPGDGVTGLEIRSELRLDPEHPGGILAIQASPLRRLQVSAALSLLPANAVMDTAGSARSAGRAAWGMAFPAQSSAATREVDLELAGDFGVVSGSLSGAMGRTGARSLPLLEEGPLSLVSFGSERFYETRLGVAYKPWEAHLEVGYLRVESTVDMENETTHGPPPDYGRLDLLLSKVLPSPRSMLGARLRALVEWQGLGYDSVLAANRQTSLSGVTARLCGGVGMTF